MGLKLTMTKPRAAGRRRRPRPPWASWSDAELLKLRFCDLGLSLARTPLTRHVERLHAELARRGIEWKPHAWLSEEWFSPDGVPGFAIPFYLAHPRLERLERRMMQEVEGGNAKWLMRIMRHEAGHALDTAYRLRRRKAWREVFGPASLPYPDSYRARPGSRRYVHHLGNWYAQAHPTEDFAETFAVWLQPNSRWRRSYEAWPAAEKLHLVNEFMTELRGRRAPVRNRVRIEPLEDNTLTLAEHYRLKIARYRNYRHGLCDELLKRVFTAERPRPGSQSAGTLLRTGKRALVAAVARELGAERYSVYQILRMAIERSENMGLYVRGRRRDALRNARWILAQLVDLYAHGASPQLPV
jgi:hypothetical protein